MDSTDDEKKQLIATGRKASELANAMANNDRRLIPNAPLTRATMAEAVAIGVLAAQEATKDKKR